MLLAVPFNPSIDSSISHFLLFLSVAILPVHFVGVCGLFIQPARKHPCLFSLRKERINDFEEILPFISMLGTVAYASRPRVQIYSFAYTSRSIHHSHYSYVSYYLVLTPVISLLTKPTPQGGYWLVYCSFVPQHVFLSFLAARSSFS